MKTALDKGKSTCPEFWKVIGYSVAGFMLIVGGLQIYKNFECSEQAKVSQWAVYECMNPQDVHILSPEAESHI